MMLSMHLITAIALLMCGAGCMTETKVPFKATTPPRLDDNVIDVYLAPEAPEALRRAAGVTYPPSALPSNARWWGSLVKHDRGSWRPVVEHAKKTAQEWGCDAIVIDFWSPEGWWCITAKCMRYDP